MARQAALRAIAPTFAPRISGLHAGVTGWPHWPRAAERDARAAWVIRQ